MIPVEYEGKGGKQDASDKVGTIHEDALGVCEQEKEGVAAGAVSARGFQ